ncbi:MAG: hypothetical protein FJW30_17370 [Acidobacteria bacterium]|nr:hypothetical protein [Acidobacteriota bacterium]
MGIFTGFALFAAAFPLESILVEGVKRLRPEQIVAASGLRPGQPAGKPDFEAAQARLAASGVLASVGFRYAPSKSRKGYTLTFEVVEIDQVFPIRFEELEKPEAELRKILRAADPLFLDPAPGTDVVLKRYAGALNAALKVSPPVIGRVVTDRPGVTAMLFRPNRPRPSVAAVSFTGNKAFPAHELQNRVAGVAVGMLYTEEGVREALQNQIRPLYESKGLLRVKFTKISAAPATDVEGLNVSIEVDEGPEFVLDDVRINGAAGAAELLKIAKFKTGEVFKIQEVTESLERLRAAMRTQGFMKVETAATRRYEDARRTVDMEVNVTPGPRFKMGRLTLKGLDITTEPEIRKLWGLKEDAYFREGYAERVLAKIREDGLLDNLGGTSVKLEYDEAAERIHVTLLFAGEKKEPERKNPPL